MLEADLARRILKYISAAFRNVRLFRNQVGQAWTGVVVKRDALHITLAKYRPIRFGLFEGSADYIGWTTVKVTPEMVGTEHAIFTALEMKRSAAAKRTAEQINFIAQVQKAGGKAGFITKEEEAKEVLK